VIMKLFRFNKSSQSSSVASVQRPSSTRRSIDRPMAW